MNCSNCGSPNIVTKNVTERFAYGEEQNAFEATFPEMTCSNCSFGWRDYRAEQAIETAMDEYIATLPKEKTVDDFKEAVRELLAEYLGDSAGTREAYREALLLLAAEL